MQLIRPNFLVASSGCAAALRGRWRLCYIQALLAMFCCAALPATAPQGAAASAAIAPGFSAALDQTAALLASQAAVGRAIGDYTLQDREGRAVRLSNYRGPKKLVSFIFAARGFAG